MTSSKLRRTAAGALLLAAAGVMIWQYRENAELKRQLAVGTASRGGARTAGGQMAKNGGTGPTLAQVLRESGRNPLAATEEMLQFARKIAPGKIGGVLEQLNKQPGGFAHDLLRTLLMARWAETDPAGALAWIRTKDVANRYADSVNFYEAWGAVDPAAAIAGLKQIPDLDRKAKAEAMIFGQLAQTDPQLALSLLRQLPPNEQGIGTENSIFGHWAAMDPQAAVAALMKMPRGFNLTTAEGGIAEYWANTDPQATLAWIDQLPPGYGKEYAKISALVSIEEQNPELAATYLDAPGVGNRTFTITHISENWAKTDPQAALEWVGNVATGTVYNNAVLGILGQMGKTDPQETAAYIAQLPDANMRGDAIQQLAETWAQGDFNGALAWAQALPAAEENTRNAALSTVMRNWVMSDPAGAGDYLMQNLQNDPAFDRLAAGLASNWSAGDSVGALAWVQALPPGKAQNDAMYNVLVRLGSDNPQIGWNVAMQMTDPALQSQAMTAVVAGLSGSDPAAAAELYAQVPAGAQQVDAATALASAWLERDPTAAAQWVGTLPAGEARDAAVTQLIGAVSESNPAGAFNWAMSVGNETKQQEQLSKVVGGWAKTDATAAAKAVQAANLPEAQKAELLNVVQRAAPGK